MKNKFLLATALVVMSLGLNEKVQAESFTYHSPESVTQTVEYGNTYYPMITREELTIPEGNYTGIRLEYIVSSEDSDLRVNSLPSDFYLVGVQPPVGQWTFMERIGVQSNYHRFVGNGSNKVSIDQPLYWYRNFAQDPVAYPGGQTLGFRHKNGTNEVGITSEWKNVKLEFYEATISSFEGDGFSGGHWHRPQVHSLTGEDYGRSDKLTPYSTISFTVEEDGIYGVHTQFKTASGAPVNFDGMILLFEGEAPITGDYSNLLAINALGVKGSGHPDINSVELSKNKDYTLVYTTTREGNYLNQKTWIGGPGKVSEK